MRTSVSFDPGYLLNYIIAGVIWVLWGTPALLVYLVVFHQGPFSARFTKGDA